MIYSIKRDSLGVYKRDFLVVLIIDSQDICLYSLFVIKFSCLILVSFFF